MVAKVSVPKTSGRKKKQQLTLRKVVTCPLICKTISQSLTTEAEDRKPVPKTVGCTRGKASEPFEADCEQKSKGRQSAVCPLLPAALNP